MNEKSLKKFNRLFIISFNRGNKHVDQRFSTWGTRTPSGTWGGYRGYAKSPQGYAKFKKPHPNEAYLGRIFNLGGTRRGWGYAEGYNFDLGVPEYQKVENPWCKWLLLYLHLLSSYLDELKILQQRRVYFTNF